MRRGAGSRNAPKRSSANERELHSSAEDWQRVDNKRVHQGRNSHIQDDPYVDGHTQSDTRRSLDKDRKGSKTVLCRYYPNCTRGEQCWFSHDANALAHAQADGAPSGSSIHSRPSSSGANTSDQSGTGHQTKHKMCTYHLQGHCSKGSSCHYAHSPKELRQRNGSSAAGSHDVPSSGVGSGLRENGHVNGRDLRGKTALCAEHIEEDEAPDSFCCPITHEILRDPVVACDGFSYERAAIKDWLHNHDTSPMTNEPLESKYLVPNRALLAAIRVMYG